MAPKGRARLGGDYASLHRRNQMLTRQVDQLSMLRELGLTINRSLELSQTLPDIANVVQGALEVRRLTIYELAEEARELRPVVAKYGDDLIGRDRLAEDALRYRGTPFEEALESGRVVFVDVISVHQVYVPLLAEYTPLGVMVLEDRLDEEPFDPEDATFLYQLGLQVALAINNAKLYALAVTDGLTGLYVRRYFDLRLHEEFDAARRYRRKFALLMFDIDHFKKFNDAHGHQTGDAVLKQVAKLIEGNTRRSDVCCRYGGEEMAVILPETDGGVAHALAEKLRAAVETHAFTGAEGQALHVTVSVGAAAFSPGLDGPAAMIHAADEALYAAKEGGRNRVVVAGGAVTGE